MIRYNLNKLLGERNLKISKVFVDTGISRSTLTKIVNNQSSMVQTETIDKLCQYLKVSPSEFFEYIPLSIDVKMVTNLMDKANRYDWQPGDELLLFYDIDMFITFTDVSRNERKSFDYSLVNSVLGNNENSISKKIKCEYNDFINEYEYTLDVDLPNDFKEYVNKVTNNNYGFKVDIVEKIKLAISDELKRNNNFYPVTVRVNYWLS